MVLKHGTDPLDELGKDGTEGWYCVRVGRNTIATVMQTRNWDITGFPGIGFTSHNNSDTEEEEREEERKRMRSKDTASHR